MSMAVNKLWSLLQFNSIKSNVYTLIPYKNGASVCTYSVLEPNGTVLMRASLVIGKMKIRVK